MKRILLVCLTVCLVSSSVAQPPVPGDSPEQEVTEGPPMPPDQSQAQENASEGMESDTEDSEEGGQGIVSRISEFFSSLF
jgi:hypothetical protein